MNLYNKRTQVILNYKHNNCLILFSTFILQIKLEINLTIKFRTTKT